MTENTAPEIEIIEEIDDEEIEPIETFEIESYGLDFDVKGLADRFKNEDITIPYYQRAEVWNNSMKSSLIESLLLGIPVPGIFFSKDPKTGQLDVIDGRQRLSAIADFYSNQFGLSGRAIKECFRGKKYKNLEPEERRKLDNSILHATIVKQLAPAGNSGIIQIFKRLNEKPTPLTAQEIRTSIFHGDFIDIVEECNNDENWRVIWGKEKLHNRLKDQEMVLRFFALRYYFDSYKRPLSSFLDEFTEKNQDFSIVGASTLENTFKNTTQVVVEGIGQDAFKEETKAGNSVFKVSIFDAAMVGISMGVENGYCTSDNINQLYQNYLKDPDFLEGTAEFTNDKDRMQSRLSAAKRVFANIQ